MAWQNGNGDFHNSNWASGKHLLITGASSGVGREIARYFYGQCRRMTLVARNRTGGLDTLLDELRPSQNQPREGDQAKKTRVNINAMDVCNAQATAELIRKIYEDDNDQIDAFINCAGGSHVFGLLETMRNEDIEEVLDVNAKAPIFWLRELLPRMKHNYIEQGEYKRAHILMLSSRSGERALPNLSVYAAAKGCVEKLIEAVRSEYASYRIAFTLVNPGSINTAFTSRWPESLRDAHNAESMAVEEAIIPIVQALDSRFALNKLSYESLTQWLGEPGVITRSDDA